MVNALEYIVAW